jgi:hypothetical protein
MKPFIGKWRWNERESDRRNRAAAGRSLPRFSTDTGSGRAQRKTPQEACGVFFRLFPGDREQRTINFPRQFAF